LSSSERGPPLLLPQAGIMGGLPSVMSLTSSMCPLSLSQVASASLQVGILSRVSPWQAAQLLVKSPFPLDTSSGVTNAPPDGFEAAGVEGLAPPAAGAAPALRESTMPWTCSSPRGPPAFWPPAG